MQYISVATAEYSQHQLNGFTMKSLFFALFVLLIAGVGAYYYLQFDRAKHQISEPEKTEPLQLPEDAEPQIQHPITEPPVIFDSNADNFAEEILDETEIEEPLPPLGESDNEIRIKISEMLGDNLTNQFFKRSGIIHRFVVTIDALPKKKLPNKFRLFPPTPGNFLVKQHSNDKITVDPDNFARYSTYMQLLDMLETEQFVKWYTRYYPLIQEAYDELGYKNRYFNDRFISVLDHLLKTPEVVGTIRLVQPKVLRIGPDNTEIVKAKLTEIRKALAEPQLDE